MRKIRGTSGRCGISIWKLELGRLEISITPEGSLPIGIDSFLAASRDLSE